MSALINASLLQIIQHKWNKLFLVAYTELDPRWYFSHLWSSPWTWTSTWNCKWILFICLCFYDLGCSWLVEHGLNGQLYIPVYTSTEECARLRYLRSCFLNQRRQAHFTAAYLLHTFRGHSNVSTGKWDRQSTSYPQAAKGCWWWLMVACYL